ncbi:WD40 repeat domain-containing protein [Streptomyces sp. WMMC500]|uniref:WD40 repeat domain-containing protein n=1 Tax=Streptomyces sp. WMMC500 TaxID=3015154 RepID=UPI00248C9002|nr:WD40 repeat domain-containing protein [Streptomyces sp. WMMC500]WBB58596.1 WD40 repeat domain-containing protein [Streptomyces sp. WMMC500]
MRAHRLPTAAALFTAAAVATSAAYAPPAAAQDDVILTDPRITESSGLAASRQHEDVYWTHNDSDDGPYVYAVDGETGETLATLTLRGIGEPRDVEAISLGPDNQLYVGDIGDNMNGSWSYVWVYRFPEPKRLADATVDAVQYEAQYEDGPRDAEALMVHPKTGRVYVVSKKEDGGAALYAGPEELATGSMNIFRRVAPVNLWVTDGAFSPDGTRMALRSYVGGRMYRFEDGRPEEDGRLDVPLQTQGESMTYTADGSAIVFGSEGEQSDLVWREAEGGGSSSESGGTGASGDGAGDDGSGAGDDEERGTVKTVLLVAGGVAVVLGLRRALSGRPRRD